MRGNKTGLIYTSENKFEIYKIIEKYSCEKLQRKSIMFGAFTDKKLNWGGGGSKEASYIQFLEQN